MAYLDKKGRCHLDSGKFAKRAACGRGGNMGDLGGVSSTGRFCSREEARAHAGPNEKVVKVGVFANGSYGCWAPRTMSGQPVGGPNVLVTIWKVVPKGRR